MPIELLFNRTIKPVNEPCVACAQLISGHDYCRDVKTRIIYHSLWCFAFHVTSSQKAIEAPYGTYR
jgi:hypothetical protein